MMKLMFLPFKLILFAGIVLVASHLVVIQKKSISQHVKDTMDLVSDYQSLYSEDRKILDKISHSASSARKLNQNELEEEDQEALKDLLESDLE